MATQLPVPVVSTDYRRNKAQVDRSLWRKLKRYAAEIGFAQEAVAAYYCTRDPETPTFVKATLVAALAYFVVPTDLIPDFVAGLGFTDDAAVLLTTLGTLSAHIKDRHRDQAREKLEQLADPDGSPDRSV